MGAPWTDRRREFGRRLEQLIDEYRDCLIITDDDEDGGEDVEVMPDNVFVVGWLLSMSWLDPADERSWTVVAHPEGMHYISRLGMAHAAVEAVG